MEVCARVLSPSVVSDSLWPQGLQPARLLYPWGSPGRNTGEGGPALLRGIFPTQESDLCLLRLLHWQVASLQVVSPGYLSVNPIISIISRSVCWLIFLLALLYLLSLFLLPSNFWLNTEHCVDSGFCFTPLQSIEFCSSSQSFAQFSQFVLDDSRVFFSPPGLV